MWKYCKDNNFFSGSEPPGTNGGPSNLEDHVSCVVVKTFVPKLLDEFAWLENRPGENKMYCMLCRNSEKKNTGLSKL